jgi:putative ABC transport system ATP-binding protein
MKVVAQNLSVVYSQGNQEIVPLKNVSFTIESGQKVALVGPSGSGKSTLFNLISGVLTPNQGDLFLDNQNWFKLSEHERALFRAQKMGIIFQNYLLVPQLTALENVMLPLLLNKKNSDTQLGRSLLQKVELLDRESNLPSQLSGGECQRVAIARALILNPPLILADEPTGQLDNQTAYQVTNLMFDLVSAQGATFILVTHDLNLAKKCDRILTLREGQILE